MTLEEPDDAGPAELTSAAPDEAEPEPSRPAATWSPRNPFSEDLLPLRGAGGPGTTDRRLRRAVMKRLFTLLTFVRVPRPSRRRGRQTENAWTELCEAIGLSNLAFSRLTAFQDAYRPDPLVRPEYGVPDFFSQSEIVQVVLGSPGEVVVTVEGGRIIEIEEFAVQWRSHTPIAYRRSDGRVIVRHFGGWRASERQVEIAVRTLRSVRRSRYHRCTSCRETNPPEWWHGHGRCQSCAERDLGIVY